MKKIFLTLLILAFVSFPNISFAQQYFGGSASVIMVCTCSYSLLISVMDYGGGGPLTLVYTPGSSNLLVGSPYGSNQLGSYLPFATCLIYSGNSCTTVNNNGLIGGGQPGFGTSL